MSLCSHQSDISSSIGSGSFLWQLLFNCSQGNEFAERAEKTAVFHSTGAVDFCSAKIISCHGSLEKLALAII